MSDCLPYRPRSLWVSSLALALCGAWITGQLLKQQTGLWPAGGEPNGVFARLCANAAAAGYDCAKATSSGWAQIRLPVPTLGRDLSPGIRTLVIPTAFMGLAYFVFLGVWLLFAGRPRVSGDLTHRPARLVAYGGLAVSLVYTSAMALGAAPRCTWCIVAHAVNFLLVLAVWRLHRGANPAPPNDAAPKHLTRREARVVIVFAMTCIAGLWLYHQAHAGFGRYLENLRAYKGLIASLQEDPEFLMREYLAQPRQAVTARRADGRGTSLVVFTDYGCPTCYCGWQALNDSLGAGIRRKLHVDVRHFPQCRRCNHRPGRPAHSTANRAAYAAEAARMQGDTAFWKMHDALLENRHRLDKKFSYSVLARRLGLDVGRFERDMAGSEVRAAVHADLEAGRELGVSHTPALFLDGRRVPSLCQTRVFWQAFASYSKTQMAWKSEE